MTESPSGQTFVASIEIDAPVESVWAEITRTGGVQRPLFNTVLDSTLEPGSPLRYRSPDGKRVFVIGRVVEIEPPTRLSHTYMFTMREEPPTLVTWELEPISDGCRVTVTHGGFTDAHSEAQKTADGWKQILALLKSEIETGRIPFKTSVTYALMGPMSFMLPKSTLAENAERRLAD